MKTKIQIKTIPDPDTEVEVNSSEHRIEEIKREIKDSSQIDCKASVLEMWEE